MQCSCIERLACPFDFVALTSLSLADDQASAFFQRCGSISSMRLFGWLGSRSSGSGAKVRRHVYLQLLWASFKCCNLRLVRCFDDKRPRVHGRVQRWVLVPLLWAHISRGDCGSVPFEST